MQKKNLIALISLILITISCNKVEMKSEVKLNNVISFRFETNNQYDWIGKMHNDGLDFILEHREDIDSTSISTVKSSVNDLTEEFFIETINNNPPESFNANTYRANIEDLLSNFESDSTNYLDSLTHDQIQFINSAKHNLDSASTASFENIIDNIIGVENSIIHSNMRENEKNLPLIYCAILRNSCIYWHDETNLNNWSLDPSICWGCIAGADATGAIVGGVHATWGAIAGGALIFGPGGAVCIGIGSAVIDGLASSGVGALIDYFFL